jgi:hypothetical protein
MITADWLNPERTGIVSVATPPWNWEDYYEANRRIQEMLNTVNHKVDLILDFSQSGQLPPNALSHLRALGRKIHPNRGLVILVGMNTFMQSIANIFMRLNPNSSKRVRLVRTMSEALQLAEEARRGRASQV